MPEISLSSNRRAGQLVAAMSTGRHARRVHASALVIPAHDPPRGLVPWWTVSGCSGVVSMEVDRPVDCRLCLGWMERHNLKIGDSHRG